jgi:hypothetical protein
MTRPPETGDLEKLRAQHAASWEQREQAERLVDDLYRDLASAQLDVKQVENGMKAVEERDAELAARATTMGVTQFSNHEQVGQRASATLLSRYKTSRSAARQFHRQEDFDDMLIHGQAYVITKLEQQKILEDRLNTLATLDQSSTRAPVQESTQGNTRSSPPDFRSIAQAVQGTQPSGPRSTDGNRRPIQPPAVTAHKSNPSNGRPPTRGK